MKKLTLIAALFVASSTLANAATIITIASSATTVDGDSNLVSESLTTDNIKSALTSTTEIQTTGWYQGRPGQTSSGSTGAEYSKVSDSSFKFCHRANFGGSYIVATQNLSNNILVSGAQTLTSVNFSAKIKTSFTNTPNTPYEVTFSLWSFSKDNSGNITVTQIGSQQAVTLSDTTTVHDVSISSTDTLALTTSDSVMLVVNSIKKDSSVGQKYGSFTISDFSLTGTIIPEPSAFGLLAGLGAIALAVSRRRKH